MILVKTIIRKQTDLVLLDLYDKRGWKHNEEKIVRGDGTYSYDRLSTMFIESPLWIQIDWALGIHISRRPPMLTEYTELSYADYLDLFE